MIRQSLVGGISRMNTKTVTIELPDKLHNSLRRAAEATQQSLEAVIVQTIAGNVPPFFDDFPADARDELLALQQLSDEELWTVSQNTVSPDQWRRHEQLLQKNARGMLCEDERQELEHLREETDRLVLRRSYALALLKWRGHAIPTPEKLPPQYAPT